MTGPPEVFISYANSDGLELSRTLRPCLVQEGITVWREIEDMIGGEHGRPRSKRPWARPSSWSWS